MHTIGQLAAVSPRALERLLGRAAAEKLSALAWNRDPRDRAHAPARAVGRRAVGARPEARRPSASFGPTLRHLADRIGSRLRAKSRSAGP